MDHRSRQAGEMVNTGNGLKINSRDAFADTVFINGGTIRTEIVQVEKLGCVRKAQSQSERVIPVCFGFVGSWERFFIRG